LVSTNIIYSPQAGSPAAELTSSMSEDDTEAEVNDVSLLPDPPNILTLVDDEDFETIIYQEIDESNNKIKKITRGVQGEIQSWSSGQEIKRLMTARDFEIIQGWIKDFINLWYEMPTIDPINFDIYENVVEKEFIVTFNDAKEILDIKIEGYINIDSEKYDLNNDLLVIQTEDILEYADEKGIDEVNIHVYFNDKRIEKIITANILAGNLYSEELKFNFDSEFEFEDMREEGEVTVYDSDNNLLNDVEVYMQSKYTDIHEQTFTTDENGYFEFKFVSDAVYIYEIEHEGKIHTGGIYHNDPFVYTIQLIEDKEEDLSLSADFDGIEWDD